MDGCDHRVGLWTLVDEDIFVEELDIIDSVLDSLGVLRGEGVQ